jgi:hypothetical protein
MTHEIILGEVCEMENDDRDIGDIVDEEYEQQEATYAEAKADSAESSNDAEFVADAEAAFKLRSDVTDRDDAIAARHAQRRYNQAMTRPTWPKKSWVQPPKREFRDNTLRFLVFDALSRSSSTARVNPVDAIRVGSPYEARDADRIAECLLGFGTSEHRNATEAHFLSHGARVLAGLMLHVLYTGETERSLAGILAVVTDPAWHDIRDIANDVLHSVHDHDQKMDWRDAYGRPTATHPGIVQRMRSLKTATDTEQSGIYTTAVRALAPFSDPLVRANTSTTDFDWDDLFEGLTLELRVSMRAQRLTPVYEVIGAILADRLDERLQYGPLRHPSFLVASPALSVR